MRRALTLGLVVMTFTFAHVALAGGNANFILGQRSLGDEVAETLDLDSQPLFGVNVDFGGDDWPVQLMAGLHVSADSEERGLVDVTVAVADISFGVAWFPLESEMVRAYIGGGVASVGVALDVDSEDDTDQSFGFYANGGVFWRLGSRFNIGVDLRMIRGTDLRLFGVDFDADYEQLGVILGFGW